MKHLTQLWFQILSHGMHSKEAIETMDMPRRCCISFEQMQDYVCVYIYIYAVYFNFNTNGVFFFEKEEEANNY